MQAIGGDWTAAAIAAVAFAFMIGVLVGWYVGNRQGRKMAQPDLDWHDFVRQNAGYDFEVVHGKADEIIRLASEISRDSKRGEKMVKTLSPADLRTSVKPIAAFPIAH